MNSKGRRRPGLRIVPDLERAAHAVSLYLHKKKNLGCSQAEANVLAFLRSRGASSLSEVHASFGHRRSTLTSLIDRLVERGLVVRVRDPSDGRAFNLKLTRAGVELANLVTAHLERLESRATKTLHADDIPAFLRVTGALVDAARKH